MIGRRAVPPPPSGTGAVAFQATAGALDRIRTGDLILTKDALYQLSYEGEETERETRLELATFSLEG